jgi:hypothetical protein
MIRSTAAANVPPRVSVNLASPGASTRGVRAACVRRRSPTNARGTTTRLRSGDRRLPARDPDDHGEREDHPAYGLVQEEAGEEPELASAGQEPTCVEAGAVDDDGHDHDPVEAALSLKDALDRPAQDKREDPATSRDPDLDRRRHLHRLADAEAALVAVGDGARQKLLDRAVEHGDGHDHR